MITHLRLRRAVNDRNRRDDVVDEIKVPLLPESVNDAVISKWCVEAGASVQEVSGHLLPTTAAKESGPRAQGAARPVAPEISGLASPATTHLLCMATTKRTMNSYPPRDRNSYQYKWGSCHLLTGRALHSPECWIFCFS